MSGLIHGHRSTISEFSYGTSHPHSIKSMHFRKYLKIAGTFDFVATLLQLSKIIPTRIALTDTPQPSYVLLRTV